MVLFWKRQCFVAMGESHVHDRKDHVWKRAGLEKSMFGKEHVWNWNRDH